MTIELKDLQDLFENKHKYIINFVETPQQEVYNRTFKVYRHPNFPEGIFMKETYKTDNYGGDDRLYSVEFVKGKEKTITVYEPI